MRMVDHIEFTRVIQANADYWVIPRCVFDGYIPGDRAPNGIIFNIPHIAPPIIKHRRY